MHKIKFLRTSQNNLRVMLLGFMALAAQCNPCDAVSSLDTLSMVHVPRVSALRAVVEKADQKMDPETGSRMGPQEGNAWKWTHSFINADDDVVWTLSAGILLPKSSTKTPFMSERWVENLEECSVLVSGGTSSLQCRLSSPESMPNALQQVTLTASLPGQWHWDKQRKSFLKK